MDEPLQTLFDVQDIRHAYDQVPARPQHSCEFANRLLRIFDVLEPFETRDVVERLIVKGKVPVKITLSDLDVRLAKDLGIKIATGHCKSRGNQASRQRAFAGRCVQQRAARQRF